MKICAVWQIFYLLIHNTYKFYDNIIYFLMSLTEYLENFLLFIVVVLLLLHTLPRIERKVSELDKKCFLKSTTIVINRIDDLVWDDHKLSAPWANKMFPFVHVCVCTVSLDQTPNVQLGWKFSTILQTYKTINVCFYMMKSLIHTCNTQYHPFWN